MMPLADVTGRACPPQRPRLVAGVLASRREGLGVYTHTFLNKLFKASFRFPENL